jgi:hypothetical protein
VCAIDRIRKKDIIINIIFNSKEILVSSLQFNSAPMSNEDIDWEKILEEDGMPSELDNQDEVPSGDPLEILDPEEAKERKESADIEEESDKEFDDKDDNDE